MKETSIERAFRVWAEERNMVWEGLRYARPEAGGETVAYRISPPAEPGGLVVTVHGAGNDSLFGFLGLMKSLLLRGFEVFAFDVDGHGWRGTTRFAASSVSTAVGEAVQRAVGARRDIPFHLIGVSLGGSLLLHSLPDVQATSAVTIAAPLRIRFSARSVMRELGLGLLRTALRERGDYGWTGLIPAFGPFRRGTYPLRLSKAPGGAFGYVSALNDALASLCIEERATAIRTPLLLLYGAEDLLVPPCQGERVARRVPGAELKVLAGETHFTLPLARATAAATLEWISRPRSPHREPAHPGSTA